MSLHVTAHIGGPGSAENALVEASQGYAHIFSHDIGGKLRVIMEFARILMEEKDSVSPEDEALYLSLILDTSTHLHNMTEGLAAYARLDGQPFVPVRVDTQLLVEDCVSEIERTLAACGGRISVSGLPEISVDAPMFRQLIQALLDNAIAFRKDKLSPVIAVAAAKEGSDWTFSVTDNGMGIEPIFYEKVLKPVKKLHTDDEYTGAGMGLAVACKIVSRHGGRIWIEPASGGGTIIKFTVKTVGYQE